MLDRPDMIRGHKISYPILTLQLKVVTPQDRTPSVTPVPSRECRNLPANCEEKRTGLVRDRPWRKR